MSGRAVCTWPDMPELEETAMSLTPETIAALAEALDDEYKARATYAKVIERFGPVRPFVNIIKAEERHAQALRQASCAPWH